MKNKYQASHPSQLKALEETISSYKDVTLALQGSGSEAESSTAATSGGADGASGITRTLARPDFEGESVPSYDTKVELEAKPMDEFNETRTFLDLFKK